MKITQKIFAEMLQGAADVWLENTGVLNEIDSMFGDGDHGVTIGKIAVLLKTRLSEWQDESISGFLEALGQGVLAISGGSAGPLYGTMLGGLGLPVVGMTEIDVPALKKMVCSSREELESITKAVCGEKTMMDALIPAVTAARETEGDILDVLEAMARAARMGADATKDMVSKYGRARSYGERTRGFPDAGAMSTAQFFEGLLAGAKRCLDENRNPLDGRLNNNK